MEQHRANPACSSCHRVIDPLGLALENFDATGAWRIKDNERAGRRRSATSTTAPRSTARPACARRCSSTRTCSCAASPRADDLCARPPRRVRTTCRRSAQIVRDAGRQNNKLSAFVLGVVNSPAFQMSAWPRRRRPKADDDAAGSRRSYRLSSTIRRRAAMYLTQKHLSRRTVLQGHRRHVALPFLEAMVPARTALGADRGAARCAWPAIEMVHGSAGSTAFGIKQNLWAPAAAGRGFDLSPSALAPLEPFRDHLTIVSNTDVRNAEAFDAAGNRRRPLPVERRVPHAVAPEADAGLRRARRHLARPVSTRRSSARTRRFRRCSCASRTSTRPAAAPTATPASTPTPSAGRRRPSRCR